MDADYVSGSIDKHDCGGTSYNVMKDQEAIRRLREIMGSDFIDAVEVYVNSLMGKYQDQYFRWLAARRDYPFLDDPAPPAPMDIPADILARLHAQWTQEFNRRA